VGPWRLAIAIGTQTASFHKCTLRARPRPPVRSPAAGALTEAMVTRAAPRGRVENFFALIRADTIGGRRTGGKDSRCLGPTAWGVKRREAVWRRVGRVRYTRYWRNWVMRKTGAEANTAPAPGRIFGWAVGWDISPNNPASSPAVGQKKEPGEPASRNGLGRERVGTPDAPRLGPPTRGRLVHNGGGPHHRAAHKRVKHWVDLFLGATAEGGGQFGMRQKTIGKRLLSPKSGATEK